MTTVATPGRADTPPERSREWRERSGRLYQELRRPARAMIRRAFRGTFGDDEIEDIYGNAWVGTLRALERRHDQLSDQEIRKYVLTAVANHASKELRRRSRRPTAPLEATHTVPDDRTLPDERAAKLEESRVARDLLATLPPRRRAVMLLRYGWGLEPRQVCGLVKGLSPRAYRKEITRGVDELTAKLGLLERGEWCADREPVLKAYAAGLADADQERQARQHLSHCRHCAEFVGKLSGHLHDIGASLVVPSAVDGIVDDRYSLADRVAGVIDGVRDSAGRALTGGGGEGAPEVATQTASVPSGARGAGAAGTGVLAKLAGLGAAGKVAAVCLGGGAAATVCLAAGITPSSLPGVGPGGPSHDLHRRAGEGAGQVRPHLPVAILPSEPTDETTAPPAPAGGDEPTDGDTPEQVPVADPEPTSPIAPSAPPTQQEFGVASAASGTASSGSSSSSGDGGSAAQREFGP
jgi:RNA polymerase sigma factor (sigma-70 family)